MYPMDPAKMMGNSDDGEGEPVAGASEYGGRTDTRGVCSEAGKDGEATGPAVASQVEMTGEDVLSQFTVASEEVFSQFPTAPAVERELRVGACDGGRAAPAAPTAAR